MADHWIFAYSYSPKPEAIEGAMLLEQDTGLVFRYHLGWHPYRRFQMQFVDLWQDLPSPTPGTWMVMDLSDWVPADVMAVQLVVQTERIAGGPERKVTFGIRGRGTTLERKGMAVMRTGVPPFRGNFITLLTQPHPERTIELFLASDGPDATAIFTLAGYFMQRE